MVNPMTEPATAPLSENAARAEAEALRENIAGAFPGFKPEVQIAEGNFWQNLKTAIERNKIDLLVLAVRRPSVFTGAARHLAMATKHKVVTHAARPVLAVRC